MRPTKTLFKKVYGLFTISIIVLGLFTPLVSHATSDNEWYKKEAIWIDTDTFTVGDVSFNRLNCSSANGWNVFSKDLCNMIAGGAEYPEPDEGIIYAPANDEELPSLIPADGHLTRQTIAKLRWDVYENSYKIELIQANKITGFSFIHVGCFLTAGIIVGCGEITMSNPEDGPTRPKKVPGRIIKGSARFISRDGTGNPFSNDLFKKLTVALYDQGGYVVPLEGSNERAVVKTGDGYKYETLTVKNSLYTNSIYSLRLKSDSDHFVDCISGKDNGLVENITNKEYCTLRYGGRVDFTVDDEGIMKIVSNADAYERSNSESINIKTLTVSNGLNLTITEYLNSPLDKAISGAIKWVLEGVTSGLKWTTGSVNTLLSDTEIIILGEEGKTSALNGPWIAIRNIALSLLVMALIIIAFANVLQVDIDKYGLNRMIPRIIISIIMAYASWIIVIFFFDFSSAIQVQAKALAGGIDIIESIQTLSPSIPTTSQIIANLGMFFVVIAIFFGVWACGIILLFTLLIRIIMLAFLLVIAPLAFILNIMPFTANLYKQWWSEFFKWMFMGPIALAIISLGGVIAGSVGFGASGTQDLLSPSNLDNTLTIANAGGRGSALIGLVIFAASLYMAATLPKQWGGKIMGAWTGVGKKVGGYAARATGVPGAAKNVIDRTAGFIARGRNRRENWIANKATGGLAGTDPAIYKRQQEDATTAEVAKRNGFATADQKMLVDRYNGTSNRWERRGIEREMAARGDFEKLFAEKGQLNEFGGWVDQKDEHGNNIGTDAIEHKARQAAARKLIGLHGSDQTLENTVLKEQAEIAYEAGNQQTASGSYGQGLQGRAIAGQKGKPPSQKRWKMLRHMTTAEEVTRIADTNDIEKAMSSDNVGSKARSEIKKAQDRRLFTRVTNDDAAYNAATAFGEAIDGLAGAGASTEDVRAARELLAEEENEKR